MVGSLGFDVLVLACLVAVGVSAARVLTGGMMRVEAVLLWGLLASFLVLMVSFMLY